VNVVLRFEPERAEDLRASLVKGGFKLDSRPHALFFAQRPGVALTAYASGKLLLTGEQAEEYAGILSGAGLARPEPAPILPTTAAFTPHVGSDESGKGDYFGPLCVAAVHVPDAQTAALLVSKGVRDSKLVPDAEAALLASLVRAKCPHAVHVLAPPLYNEVYDRFGNLNTLLADCHGRALERLLAQTGPVPVVVDQFARPEVLLRRLGEKARGVEVTQAVRAESDVAVAAASLVARAEFLAGLAQLEVQHGLRLPKGAGVPVVRAAREMAAKGGKTLLRQVAKLHFATTQAALGERSA
jgi:ribonuclease HIII